MTANFRQINYTPKMAPTDRAFRPKFCILDYHVPQKLW